MALLLLSAAGAASYLNVQRLIANKKWVEHTRQFLEEVDKIDDGIKEAESARRSYVITGQKIDMETYRAGIETTNRAIKVVRHLTVDNPHQQQRLDEVKVLIDRRLAVLQRSIDLLQQKNLDRLTQIELTNQGRKLQKEVKAKLAEIDNEERNLLNQRSAAADISDRQTIWVVGISYFLSFSLLSGIYFLLSRQIRDRIATELALQRANEQLEARVQQRTAELLKANEALQAEIVERLRVEEALKSYGAEYQDLYNNAPCGYHSLDTDGTFVLINDTALKMLGYTREEIIGKKKFSDLLSPESLPTFQENFPRFKEQGWVQDLQFQMIRKDGTILPVSLNATAIKDAAGHYIMSRSSMIDISDRKRAEAALRDSEQRYATLADASPVGIFRTDAKGECVYVNQRWCEFAGIRAEEALKEGWIAALHPDDRERVLVQWSCFLQENWPFKSEYRFQRPNGRVIWVLGQAVAEKDATGKVIGYVGTVTNINDRQQAEAALRDSERQYATLTEAVPVGIFRSDPTGYYLYVNDRWCQMTGLTLEEALGFGWVECLHPDDRDRIMTQWHETSRAQLPYHGEFRLQHPDGSVVWIFSQAVPYKDAAGEVTSYIGSFTDISDRKQAEATLQQQAEQQQLILEISQRIRRSLNLEEILETTVEEVRQFLHTDRVIVFRFEPLWRGTVLVESIGAEWMPILSSTIYDPCFRDSYIEPFKQGRVTAKADIYTAGISQCHLDLLGNFQVRANLVVPILKGEDLWGLLIAHHCAAPRQWQPLEIDLLRQLATQVGIAIQQSTLFEQVQSELIERRRTEEALRQSEQRWQLAIAGNNDGIWDRDLIANQYFLSQRCLKILGYADGELDTFDKWATHIHPDDFDGAMSAFQAHLDRQTPYYVAEYRMRCKDTSYKWLLVRGQALWDEAGKPVRAVGSVTDITERKQAEETLQKAKDELEMRVRERTKELTETNATLQSEIAERIETQHKLEQITVDLKRSNEELEQFAYVASHDLQEPLRAIEGYTQLLVQEYKDRFDESAQEYADFIIDGASRMRQLIQDLLTYSRVGTRGKAFTPTDCNQVLRLALQNLQVAIAESNAIITYDELPTVTADTNQLVQLFQNLIGNAIKFRRQEPPQIHIGVVRRAGEQENRQNETELPNAQFPMPSNQPSTQHSTDEYFFWIRDNGIGIKSQYLDRIFVIFKRLHTRKQFPGTGIGLAICKKIVERHGGRIWAESQLGVGTTFFFTLPITSNISHPEANNSDD